MDIGGGGIAGRAGCGGRCDKFNAVGGVVQPIGCESAAAWRGACVIRRLGAAGRDAACGEGCLGRAWPGSRPCPVPGGFGCGTWAAVARSVRVGQRCGCRARPVCTNGCARDEPHRMQLFDGLRPCHPRRGRRRCLRALWPPAPPTCCRASRRRRLPTGYGVCSAGVDRQSGCEVTPCYEDSGPFWLAALLSNSGTSPVRCSGSEPILTCCRIGRRADRLPYSESAAPFRMVRRHC